MSAKRWFDIKMESLDDDVMRVDGFDDAVIGVARKAGGKDVLAYSCSSIIEQLVADGMSMSEALEHFEYNIVSAYVGEGTPVFIDGLSNGS